MKTNEIAILRLVISTGIASVVVQLVTIREFLAQFQGNEFVIALILFNWLLLGGIGTLLAHQLTRSSRRISVVRLGWFSLCLAGLSPLQIAAIRELRDVFFIHGSSVGFYQILAYIGFTIAPYTLLLGFLLPYSLFVLRIETPGYPGARIYISDNIGDVMGGALFSFVLVYIVTPFWALCIANLILVIAAFCLFPPEVRYRPGTLFITLAVMIVLILGITIEKRTLAPIEGRMVHYRESRYGRITVHQDQEQFTLFMDGVPYFSSQNLMLAEEAVHYPLSQVEDVKDVLLISAEGGMMVELEKYGLRSIDYVELNPEVTRVLLEYGLISTIPGLKMFHQDGRAYLTETEKRYDAIIVNLPDPETFQVNRFFTDEFFSLANRRINAGGVLSFSIRGFDNYLSEPHRQKLSSLFNTVSAHFDHVLLLPGQRIFFLCRTRPLDRNIPARLADKGIPTRYVQGFFYGNVTDERIDRLNQLVDPAASKNYDYSPRLIQIAYSKWFVKFSTSPLGFFVVLAILSAVYMIRISREEFILFTTGCMTMGSELLVIFAFQIFFGYIYFQIGLIITVFLAGLLPGAWMGTRIQQRVKAILILTDGVLIALMGVFLLALGLLGDLLPAIFFLIFGFSVSMACGFQFPVVLRLGRGERAGVTRAFSADLIGAACGTLLISVVLIPYVGIMWATTGLICLKLISLLVVGMYHETVH